MKPIELDYDKLDCIQVDGIDMKDYPKFTNAYITHAEIDGKELTDEQYELLNEDYDFVYAQVERHLY